MNFRRVLVTGAGGQLAHYVARAFSESEVVALDHRALDITDPAAVAAAVDAAPPDVIVNCAAFNDVDGAEERPEQALAVNAFAVRSLALAAEQAGAVLVHFSTDFVFDGTTDRPYLESDVPNPRGVYAVSKLLGEWMAVDSPRHYVLRVESLFGGPHARSSVDKILDNILAGTGVRAFSDRTVSPSYVEDVVSATSALLSSISGSAPSCGNTPIPMLTVMCSVRSTGTSWKTRRSTISRSRFAASRAEEAGVSGKMMANSSPP